MNDDAEFLVVTPKQYAEGYLVRDGLTYYRIPYYLLERIDADHYAVMIPKQRREPEETGGPVTTT